MTASRGKVEASLAERGRPAMWANEQEAAVLSGYSPEAFRKALPMLEKAGFPPVIPRNGLRFIPAIVDFWRREVDAVLTEVPKFGTVDETNLENFDEPGQRRTA